MTTATTATAAPRPEPPVHRSALRVLKNGLALAGLMLRLTVRDRRAFFINLIFPLTFVFLYGFIARLDGAAGFREWTSRLIATSIVTNSFFGQGMTLVVQRERGMLRRYRLTPLGSSGLLCGIAIAGLVMVAFIVCIQFAIWGGLFGAQLRFQVLPFILVALIGSLAMASLGLIIAAVASTMQEAQPLFQMTFLASLFLSGMTVPLELMGVWVRRLSLCLPMTYMMSTLTHALTGRVTLREDAVPLLALIVMSGAAFHMAAKLFRWEREDPLPRKAKLSALLAILPVLLVGLWQNAHTARPVIPPMPSRMAPPPAPPRPPAHPRPPR